MNIKVGISARHVHLTKEHYEYLFGAQVKIIKDLGQGGWASDKKVVVVGLNGRTLEARVLGPFREASQVELSLTDSVFLGFKNLPIRLSGDIANTPAVKIIGELGEVVLDQGLIIAKRHIHINPHLAKEYNLTDHQLVSVKFSSERSLVFADTEIKITDNDMLPVMHIDTDEGNAANLSQNDLGEIII